MKLMPERALQVNFHLFQRTGEDARRDPFGELTRLGMENIFLVIIIIIIIIIIIVLLLSHLQGLVDGMCREPAWIEDGIQVELLQFKTSNLVGLHEYLFHISSLQQNC